MLCSMCQHGTTKFWKCTCGEHNCNHMLECTKCKSSKYTIEKLESTPDHSENKIKELYDNAVERK